MTNDEYETVLGKLVIMKLFMTKPLQDEVDILIEAIETEYLERRSRNKL